ncbi:MAG: hypothetical protein LWX01_11915, partial [Deltaproteobacteria bacterium]|nr:hypothetical protein [Deltaproteobacteria bacterium]
ILDELNRLHDNILCVNYLMEVIIAYSFAFFNSKCPSACQKCHNGTNNAQYRNIQQIEGFRLTYP